MLPQSGFLVDATPKLRSALAALAQDVTLGSGEVLFHQGDAGEALYAVVTGSLEVSVLAEDGRKLVLDVMRAGSILGEIALFDPGERTATVIAAEPTQVLKVGNADMLQAIREDADLAVDVIRLAGLRMRWMNGQIMEQAFLPLAVRLARWIIRLADEHGVVAMSQGNLSEFAGTTREAVSKTIATWKRDGIVDRARGGIRIVDRVALSTIAHLDMI